MRTRRAEVVDAERLAAFAAHTFTDTFGEANRPEDLEQFVRETYGVAQQTRELEDPGIVTILIGTMRGSRRSRRSGAGTGRRVLTEAMRSSCGGSTCTGNGTVEGWERC
jgi:hypothetical protein